MGLFQNILTLFGIITDSRNKDNATRDLMETGATTVSKDNKDGTTTIFGIVQKPDDEIN